MAIPNQAAGAAQEVLHQRKKLSVGPLRLVIGGVTVTAILGYAVMLTKKKPAASAMDVAKVTTGIYAHPRNTHPHK